MLLQARHTPYLHPPALAVGSRLNNTTAPPLKPPGAIFLNATSDPALEVPGFKLLEKLGEGGMGEVYRAIQVSLQRYVAVKILLNQATDSRPVAEFKMECRMMAALAHRHIVTIHDCGQ